MYESLVKSTAWTHNTNVNKHGYAPLQLVTGKACNLPGLTMGNEATESVLDTEAVQKVIEEFLRTQEEFRKVEMRLKLKDCQDVRVREYLHRDRYVEGDKVWYKYQDSNAWLVPAEVLYHKENKVWVFVNGNKNKKGKDKDEKIVDMITNDQNE